jgi:hypothetical protein
MPPYPTPFLKKVNFPSAVAQAMAGHQCLETLILSILKSYRNLFCVLCALSRLTLSSEFGGKVCDHSSPTNNNSLLSRLPISFQLPLTTRALRHRAFQARRSCLPLCLHTTIRRKLIFAAPLLFGNTKSTFACGSGLTSFSSASCATPYSTERKQDQFRPRIFTNNHEWR